MQGPPLIYVWNPWCHYAVAKGIGIRIIMIKWYIGENIAIISYATRIPEMLGRFIHLNIPCLPKQNNWFLRGIDVIYVHRNLILCAEVCL